MNRREFLHPHCLVAAAPPTRETALLRLARRAMATTFEIVLPFDSDAALAHGQAAFDLLDQLEDQLTVYREHSEVCRLNRTAFHAPVPVERGLFDLLREAARVTEETEGAFDVTAGRSSRRGASFAGRGACRPTRNGRRRWNESGCGTSSWRRNGKPSFTAAAGWKSTSAPSGRGTRSIGWAIFSPRPENSPQSCCTAAIAACTLGEVRTTTPRLAGGHLPPLGRRPPPGRGVAARPVAGDLRGHVPVSATRGPQARPHPRPAHGWPASGLASATVVAPTGAEADALSTAFYVGGVETARRYCDAHPDVGAVLLPEGDGAELVILNLAS